jgi:hypothetical protein
MAMRITTDTKLAELVNRYQVCWEVWPEICAGQHHQQVGYELELFGSDTNIQDFQPGGAECARIHAALQVIAAHVFEVCDDVFVEMIPDGQCLRYSPARGNRPGVTYSVKMLHRCGYENPVDEAERTYLDKVKTGLRRLGASEHAWHGIADHEERLINAGERA